MLTPSPASFNAHACFDNSVLFLCGAFRNDDVWLLNRSLNGVSEMPIYFFRLRLESTVASYTISLALQSPLSGQFALTRQLHLFSSGCLRTFALWPLIIEAKLGEQL